MSTKISIADEPYRGMGVSHKVVERFQTPRGQPSIEITGYFLPCGFGDNGVEYRPLGYCVFKGCWTLFGSQFDLQPLESCQKFVAERLATTKESTKETP